MDTTSIRNRVEYLPQPYIVLGVTVLAIAALVPGWMNYDIIARDGAHLYVPVASLFLEGRFHEAMTGPYVPTFPLPLYETLIFMVSKITGFAPETAGRLVAAGSFVLGSVGIYLTVELLFKNRLTALLGVLLYVSNRRLLLNSVDCLKETLLVCIIVWGNFCILKGLASDKRRWVWFAVGSLLILSGMMVRSTALIFLGAWLFLWVVHKREGLVWRGMVLLAPLFIYLALGLLMPTLPIFRRSLSVYGFLHYFKTSYQNIWQVGYASSLFIYEYVGLWQYLMALFGLVGLYHLRKTPYTRHYLVVFLGFFIICISIGWNYSNQSSERYIYALAIWLIPAIAYEIARCIQTGKPAVKYLAILTIVALPFLWANRAFDPPDPDRLARKEAGVWIASRMGPHWDIISNRERVAFYAHGNIVYLVNVMPMNAQAKTIIGNRYPDKVTITMSDVFSSGSIKKPIAMDIELEDGKRWVGFLKNNHIRPSRIFRKIYVYLPDTPPRFPGRG